MSLLRQALYGIALFSALALLIWGQSQRITMEINAAKLARQEAQAAHEDAQRYLRHAQALHDALQQERQAQQHFRKQQDQLRQGLAQRAQQIEALKSENTQLRDWAAQPLPDFARRLRQRPALTGADAYRQWMSDSSPLPTTSHRAEH